MRMSHSPKDWRNVLSSSQPDLTVRNKFNAKNLSLTHFLTPPFWIDYTQVDPAFRGFLALNSAKCLPQRHCMVTRYTAYRPHVWKNVLFYQLWVALSDLLILQHSPSSWPTFCSTPIVLCTYLIPHSLPRLKSKQFQTFWSLFTSKSVHNFLLLFSHVFHICSMFLCCSNTWT